MWQIHWMLSLLPDTMFIWITYLLFGLGIVLYIVSKLVQWIPMITRYKLPVLMIVISNSVYGWIKASQKSGYDERYYSVDFSRTNHAKVAEAYGVRSWTVDDPLKLEAAIKAAIECGEPALVDIISQPLQDAAAPVSQWMG